MPKKNTAPRRKKQKKSSATGFFQQPVRRRHKMSFENGILNLANWAGNVILPTLAGLFIAVAILQFSKSLDYSHALYGAFACLMVSGLTRALETFASQRAWND